MRVQEQRPYWKGAKPKVEKADYRTLFEDLSRTLPSGCASLVCGEEPTTGELIMQLIPASGKAARIEARVEMAVGVTLSFGEGAVFEVPLKGMRYTNLPCLEEVRALCLAVIAGRFEEVVYTAKSEVLGAKAKILLEKPVVESWRALRFYPFRKTEKKYLTYAPYCTESAPRGPRH